MKDRVHVIQGDLTRLDVDAIVNAANESLLGGGGVDGAIHRAAGPELLAECRTLGGCPTGQAKITRGYRLKAKHVIHTPGPVWAGGDRGEEELLRSCYRECLTLAAAHALERVAFPCISTGIYGYPKEDACIIAVDEVLRFLRSGDRPRRVTFCCFGGEDFGLYEAELGRALSVYDD
jgi:O-acetyl-ADP-ribose deacetylase (regulator of RNase III)